MVHLLFSSIIIAAVAAFILTLAYKWGWIEYAQVHGNKLINKWANCSFCLSFWTCLALAMLLAVATSQPAYLICPIISTCITKALL